MAVFGSDSLVEALVKEIVVSLLHEAESDGSPTFGKHIIHLEDLKPSQLLDLFRQWNLGDNHGNISVTEKVDGGYVKFGVDAGGKFYLGSKNTRFQDLSEIPSFFFFDNTRRYFTLLKSIPLKQTIQRALRLKTLPTSVELQGEAIPSYDHNVVIYDQKKIGDGIYVLFGVNVNGKVFTDRTVLDSVVKELGGQSPIKFYAAPQVNIKAWENIPNTLVVSLEKLIQKHGNFLAKPARSPDEKALKTKVLDLVNKIGATAKKVFLSQTYQSPFGTPETTPEGFVLALPNGDLVKVVDKEEFTRIGAVNWRFIKQLMAAEKDFTNTIRKDPKSLVVAMKSLEQAVNTTEKEFEQNRSTFTSPKKMEETEKSIELLKQKIDGWRRELKSGTPPETVSANIVGAKGKKSLDTSAVMQESGNVFGDTSGLPKELLQVNVQHALKSVGLEKANYTTVGNTNRPVLGDIDVAISKDDLLRAWSLDSQKIDDQKTFWNAVKEKLKEFPVETKVNPGLKQFNIKSALVSPETDSKPKFIQVDVFVGHLDWMSGAMSGAPVGSKTKAKYRNILLYSAFRSIIWEPDKDNPSIKGTYFWDTQEGLKQRKYQTLPSGKNKVIEPDRLVTNNLDKAVSMLFGSNTTWKDVDSFEKVSALIQSPKFRFPELRDEVWKRFKEATPEFSGG